MRFCARRRGEPAAIAEMVRDSRDPPSHTLGEGTDAARSPESTAVQEGAWSHAERGVGRRWARLLFKYWGIKRQQWLFHSIGRALQLASLASRERLSETYRIQP